MFIRTPYNYDVDSASLVSGLICVESSRTQQNFKEECDINTIIKRFGMGYEMPPNWRAPTYGDFSEVHDYHAACNAIAEAHEQFDLLPATVRERFRNDPGELIEFVSNEANREEAVLIGLLPKPSVAPPVLPVAAVPGGDVSPPA